MYVARIIGMCSKFSKFATPISLLVFISYKIISATVANLLHTLCQIERS